MTTGLCLDGLSLALSQISFAVTDLSKKNFKSNVSELKNVSYTKFSHPIRSKVKHCITDSRLYKQ